MSFLGSAGRVSRGGAALLRHRGIVATAAAAAAVLIAGCTYAATAASGSGSGSGQEKLTSVSDNKLASAHQAKPAIPLKLVSVTPTNGTAAANGGAPITLTFSSPLSATTPLPTVSPAIQGSWAVSGDTATFTPASGFLPDTTVTVHVPAGITAASATTSALKTATTVSYKTGTYSTLRLQELLTQLGYLPLDFNPTNPTTAAIPATDANAQVSAAYDPPGGTFSFQSGYPSELTDQWQTGAANILDTGAIRAFEYNSGLTMDGIAGPQVWAALLTAVAKNQQNPSGYSYALASQGASDETLQVWHDGKQILDSPMNSGIAASPTADGTFPVYERLQFQYMQGTNPDGTHYDDPVSWISYFNGGDAIHAFVRASYGWYQSLGCVELPPATGQFIWPYLTYGTLVTVQGPVA